MSRPLHILPAAHRDLARIRDWYEKEQAGFAAKFALEVDETMRRIADSPLAFPLFAKRTRRARLRRFPYSLCFVTTSERLLVTGVIHNHRGPNTWQSRVREKQPGAYEARP
jgi:toxin ParE2